MNPVSRRLDVYDVWVHVVTTRRQLSQLRRKYGGVKKIPLPDGELGATCRFCEEPSDGPDVTHYVVYVDVAAHRGDMASLLDTVAHEATHTGCLILDGAAARYDGESEPLAFLCGWLTSWIYAQVTR